MRNKSSLIISIILIVVAILLFLKGDNTGRTVVFALLIIINLLNIIRGFINIWNEGR